MKLLFPCHSSNEYSEASGILIEFTTDQMMDLLAKVTQCESFLIGMEGDRFSGHVALTVPFRMDVLTNRPEHDTGDLDSCIVRMPDDWEPADDDIYRSECHEALIFPDGDVELKALSKYCSDSVRANLLDRKDLLVLAEGGCPFETFKPEAERQLCPAPDGRASAAATPHSKADQQVCPTGAAIQNQQSSIQNPQSPTP